MRNIIIEANFYSNGEVQAYAKTEGGNIVDSHYHSSEGWLLDEWGFHESSTYIGDDSLTHFDGKRNKHHWNTLYEILREPFTLTYGDKKITVYEKDLGKS